MTRRFVLALLVVGGSMTSALAQGEIPAPSGRTADTGARTSAILPQEAAQPPRSMRSASEQVAPGSTSVTEPPMKPSSGRK